MKLQIVMLDVREDIKSGREPFSRIMLAVSRLQDGEKLLLIAPFKPAPLFDVLANQGFAHEARPVGNGDWEVLFSRASAAGTPPAKI